jgi:HD-like signal output (HDOD) protein
MEEKNNKRKILFVDDEKQILKALRRLFFNTEFNCFFAEGGKEALVILKNYDINLIVSDIRMPEMDGFELLKKVKQHYPKVIRIALSGYSNRDEVVNAIEKNLAKLYLYKPWENSELLSIVRRTFELEDILSNHELLKYINNLESLPTVPTLYRKINEMLVNNQSIDKITNEIERDQSLASKILKVANSAFYEAKTGSVKQAVMYIGLINVKSIVVSNSIFQMTDVNNVERLWKHAILTNKMAGYIYKKILFKKIPSEYSTAGLLHDIGRVIIMNYASDVDAKINTLLNNNVIDLSDRIKYENKLIGFDHAKIGGYLLNWWGIPLPIVEAALFHHDPLNQIIMNKEIVAVIYLANIISWKIMEPKMKYDIIDDRVIESLNIPKDKFYKKIDEFIELESN